MFIWEQKDDQTYPSETNLGIRNKWGPTHWDHDQGTLSLMTVSGSESDSPHPRLFEVQNMTNMEDSDRAK